MPSTDDLGPAISVPVQSIGARILGLIYIYTWIKRERLRKHAEWFKRGTIGLLILYLIALVVEVVAHLMGNEVQAAPLAIQVLFFFLIVLLLWLQITEFSGDRQHLYFSEAASKIVELLTTGASPDVKKLLAITVEQFRQKGTLNANLALVVEGSEKLRISPENCHGQDYDLEVPKGHGACGHAFAERQIVCIPRKNYRNAIVQKTNDKNPYGMVEDCYRSLGGVEPFESLLSVPLLAYGKCYGVLNLDSKKKNAFRPLDFAQAMFYASVVALILGTTIKAQHTTQCGILKAQERGKANAHCSESTSFGNEDADRAKS